MCHRSVHDVHRNGVRLNEGMKTAASAYVYSYSRLEDDRGQKYSCCVDRADSTSAM